jgi:hypothetical protein
MEPDFYSSSILARNRCSVTRIPFGSEFFENEQERVLGYVKITASA